MTYNNIKEEIVSKISVIFNTTFDCKIDGIEIEQPQDIKNGHFSTNVALKNSKVIGDNPRNIATKIVENFEKDSNIEKVEIAGPGFINFYLSNQYFINVITEITKNNDFGKTQVKNPEKINIEYVSANPTGDLHLGHARNAVYGDALARILRATGQSVTTEYYVNDAGAQMDNLGKSVQYFYLELCGKNDEFPEDGYRGLEIKAVATEIYNEFKDEKVDEPLSYFREVGYKRNLSEIEHILKELNIEFDVWASEQYYHDSNKVKDSLDILQKTGDLYEEEGAKWLATEKYGDDKNRVIEKSDGSHTYFTSDIAYHIDKYDRRFDRLINIWGGDHHGYIKRVKAAVESLGYSPTGIEIILIQMVSILKNEEVVKMSKRSGTSVTIKDLLKELDVEAVRYFFIMRSPDTQLDFDIALAQKQSSENPVYYIQYAAARIASIMKKAKEQEITITNELTNVTEFEVEIGLLLAKFPEVIKEAATKRLPHIVANYLYDLATNYHRYYNQEKVFGNDDATINSKLVIAGAIRQVISNGLDLLGIEVKDQM